MVTIDDKIKCSESKYYINNLYLCNYKKYCETKLNFGSEHYCIKQIRGVKYESNNKRQ